MVVGAGRKGGTLSVRLPWARSTMGVGEGKSKILLVRHEGAWRFQAAGSIGRL